MALQVVPEWIVNLDDEDVVFIKRFLLASGSLKAMAKQYDVTYPTVRLRLDKLIQKIQVNDSTESEPYIALIKRLAINDRLDFDTAKILIGEYKKIRKEVATDEWNSDKLTDFSTVYSRRSFITSDFVEEG